MCLLSADRTFFFFIFLNLVCLRYISCVFLLSLFGQIFGDHKCWEHFLLDRERWHQVLDLQALCYLKRKETCSSMEDKNLKIHCQSLPVMEVPGLRNSLLEVKADRFSLGIAGVGAADTCSSGCID